MSLVSGSRIGSYEIIGVLGSGGMGEVYRARDLRLGRDVAIKILLNHAAAEPDRLARFEREARVLASLNHPSIATIYGIEESNGVRAIAMELVEGKTLAELLATRRGSAKGLPISECLAIAGQIADALDAAHERGIIHRDLKPANIALTAEGSVKVLDFGLAKAIDATVIGTDPDGRTRPSDQTREGLVVGTIAYMSPEQARGQPVDKRADIWAFGCVLFEMLTGRAPFAGATTSDTIVHVLNGDPDWTALPPATPDAVHRLLERCLEKDTKRRQRDIGDARRDLDAPIGTGTARAGERRLAFWTGWAIAIVALALAAVGWSARLRSPGEPPQQQSELRRITFDGDYAIEPAVSPDGSLIVYASDAGSGGNLDLWLQRGGAGTPIRLTNDAADDHSPTFSADGTMIAFRSERSGGGVYVMPSLGGDARLIAEAGRDPRFSPDGTRIVYWTGSALGGTRASRTAMFVVPANGGPPQRLAEGFSRARHPIWSPDGRGLLFFGSRSESLDDRNALLNLSQDRDFDWWWLPTSGGEPVSTGVYPALIARGVSFLPSTGGDPVPAAWGADGVLFSLTTGEARNLWRVRISPVTGKIDGDFTRLTTGAGTDVTPSADRSGRIAFQVAKSNEAVFALDLDPSSGYSTGRTERLVTGWEFGVHRGSLSQDGRVLAYPRQRPNSTELWVRDLVGGSSHHLTTTPVTELNPVISADGSRIGYTVVDNQRPSAYAVAAAGGPIMKICDDCIVHAWPREHTRVLAEFPGTHPLLRVVDVANGSTEGIFDMESRVSRTFTTDDDRWIVVGGENMAWIAPFKPGRVATPTTSVEIRLPQSNVIASRVAGLSADGHVLYALLGLDGFRCLYGQRIDTNRGPIGQPFVVHHFHDPARRWGSTPMGNAVVNRGFVFDQVETSSSIWLLDRAGKQ